jgi:hypothetical protein
MYLSVREKAKEISVEEIPVEAALMSSGHHLSYHISSLLLVTTLQVAEFFQSTCGIKQKSESHKAILRSSRDRMLFRAPLCRVPQGLNAGKH